MDSQRSLRKKFTTLLLEAIDETLTALDENSKTAIYHYLAKAFNVNRQEIPDRGEDFSRALERLFGLGAKHLEILFMKSLYAKVGGGRARFSWEWVLRELTFGEYVRLMRQSFEEASRNEPEMGILINENEELQRCN